MKTIKQLMSTFTKAILGLIAWVLLSSLGILIARYFKPMWSNYSLNSYRAWFSVNISR
jgi:hypothetical protein